MGDNLTFAYRTALGLRIKRGLTNPTDILNKEIDFKIGECRSMQFSADGSYFAYCDSDNTVCIDPSDGRELFTLPLAKTSKMMFSPRNELLVTFEPWVLYGGRIDADGNERTILPNLRFFSVKTGEKLAEFTVKNARDWNWRPFFTDDDKMFLRVENSELHFHRVDAPQRYYEKHVIHGISNLSVSPGLDPLLACFVVGNKGNPASIQLRNLHDKMSIICQRTSFNSDKCTLQWNSRGNAVLAVSSADVDKSNKSYYGTSTVFLMTKSGDDYKIALDKEGPLHHLEWAPSGNQFIVCQGYMPSQIVVFNMKASVVWDLKEGFRNEIYYNRFGNLLAVCGFGNIAGGKIQIYDTSKEKEVIVIEVPDTTYFEWAPDGQHFITATTAPRLRLNNNYRTWHYTGRLLYEERMLQNEKSYELAQIAFLPMPHQFNEFQVHHLTDAERKELLTMKHPTANAEHPVSNMQKAGIVSESSRYVPPAMRKAKAQSGESSSLPGAGGPPKKEVPDVEKKRRQLAKKVKEAIELKKRHEADEFLEANQLLKVERLAVMLEELESLTSLVGVYDASAVPEE